MDVRVSVLSVVYNEAPRIERLIESILNQTYQNFELIIVDDGSTDETPPKIAPYLKHQNVFCIRNSENRGIAYSRNRAWLASKGEFIFFIDGDCMATRNWIQEGLEMFQKNPGLVGLEGITYYENCLATASNHITQVLSPGTYQTCNIVYRRSVRERAGGFNEAYRNYNEDTDFGKRVINICGEIGFDKDLIVIHQEKRKNLKTIFAQHKERVNHQISQYLKCKKSGFIVIYPQELIILFFPFFLLLYYRFRYLSDIKYILFKYFALVYSRFHIWKLAVSYRKLII